MKNTDFNELAEKAYRNAEKHGFLRNKPSGASQISMVATELCEAIQADRVNKWAKRKSFERQMAICGGNMQPAWFEIYIKDTVEDELADAVIRLLTYCHAIGYKINNGPFKKEKIEEYLKYVWLTDEGQLIAEFPERIFAACLSDLVSAVGLPDRLMFSIFAIAQLYKVDLLWFVREKMMYNETRDFLHGKNY